MRGLMFAAIICAAPASANAGWTTDDCSTFGSYSLNGVAQNFCECSKVTTPIEQLQCFDDALSNGLSESSSTCKIERDTNDPYCTWPSETLTAANLCRFYDPLERLACYNQLTDFHDLAYSHFLRIARDLAADEFAQRAMRQALEERQD